MSARNCSRGFFVTGTDTNVGKTLVAGGLAAALNARLNRKVKLWKPVQSGVRLGNLAADSWRLAAIGGSAQAEEEIASITLNEPLAPWIAAQRENVEIDFHALVEQGRARLQNNQPCIIEGAGGLFVPITERKLVVDFAASLGLPLLIVARPGLGTVNHTLLTIASARQAGLHIAGVVLNGCSSIDDIAINENAMMIERFGGAPVLGKLPWVACDSLSSVGEWAAWAEKWRRTVQEHIDINVLMQLCE